MKHIFTKFLSLIAVAGFLVSSASAVEYPLFAQPSHDQTGSYTISSVDSFGDLSLYPFSGMSLEVITEGDVVVGTTIAPSKMILWGQVMFPDNTLYFQSAMLTVVPYERNYNINLYVLGYTDVLSRPTGLTPYGANSIKPEVVASGHFKFDPDGMGDGRTIDLVLEVFHNGFYANRVLVEPGYHTFRLTRHITNAVTNACDRSTVVDFSPVPPVTQCN